MSGEKRYYNGTKKEWVYSWFYPLLTSVVLSTCLFIVPPKIILILAYIVIVFFVVWLLVCAYTNYAGAVDSNGNETQEVPNDFHEEDSILKVK